MRDAAPPTDVPAGSLAGLIARLGADVATWDRGFARQLALALAAEAETLVVAPIERLQLEEVVLTFSLGDALSVVVTGRLPDAPGELTLRWRASDLMHVDADLSGRRLQGRAPYLVCCLDFGPAGRHGLLTRAAGGIPAGQVVRVRARATIGSTEEWRVQGLGLSATVPIGGLTLLDHDA